MTAPAALAASACLLVFVAGAAGAGGADPSFAPGDAIPVGPTPVSVVVVDLNGDGNPDLAVAGSNDVTILLGNGAGGFSAAPGSPLKAGESPISVTSADFNGDGKADLAVASQDQNDVLGDFTILLGDGSGRFTPASGSPVKVGGTPMSVTAADLNGDGKPDLAVPVDQNRIAILLGDGSGRFAPAVGSPVAVSKTPNSVAIADFNSDGKPDLAVASESKRIPILLGDGSGRFAPAVGSPFAGGNYATSVAVADFNGDGKPDLAFASRYSNTNNVAILLGNGAGGFPATAGSPIAAGGTGLAIADFNGDGKPDLATANYEVDTVAVLLGNGAGRFRPAAFSPFSPFSLLGPIAAADFNGDGKADILTLSQVDTWWPAPPGNRILFQTQSMPRVVGSRPLRRRPDAVFSTRGLITTLAADGNRAAVVTTKGSCSRVVVWTAPGGKSRSFKPYVGCSEDVSEVALGAGEVAWIEDDAGNSLYLHMIAARLSGGAPKEIEEEDNNDGAEGDPTGGWVGQLLGGGPLLAYNSWTVDCNLPPDTPCEDPLRLRAVDEMLVRISARRRVLVRRGPSSYPLSAVGGGRMAVDSAGAITVLAPSGSIVATVPAVKGNPSRAIALSRTRLAVARTFTLDLYNPATGAAAKSLPLGPAAALQLAGVNSKLALLWNRRRLVLARLSDGKLVSLPLRPGAATGVVDARLTEAGLFYAYNVSRAAPRGRVVFELTAKLLARF